MPPRCRRCSISLTWLKVCLDVRVYWCWWPLFSTESTAVVSGLCVMRPLVSSEAVAGPFSSLSFVFKTPTMLPLTCFVCVIFGAWWISMTGGELLSVFISVDLLVTTNIGMAWTVLLPLTSVAVAFLRLLHVPFPLVSFKIHRRNNERWRLNLQQKLFDEKVSLPAFNFL